MPADLRDVLRDLTEDARDVRPTPSGSHQLWAAGVRRRRGTTAGRVLVGLAVVALAAFVLPWLPASVERPEPAADDTTGAVPDHFWSPGAWADGTAETPPGRLALVAEAERGTWWAGRRTSWYGVTADGQDYVWLDLPGQPTAEASDGRQVALSPDGRWIGYWLSGTPLRDDAQSDVVGIAAYDTVTGKAWTRRIPTDHGLSAGALAWSQDSDRLVAAYGQYHRRQGLSSNGEAVSWAPGRDALTRVPGLDGSSGLAPGLGGVVSGDDEGGLLMVDVWEGTTRRLPLEANQELTDGGVPDSVVPSPTGSRVAMRGDLPLGEGMSTMGLWVAEREGTRLVGARLLDRRWQLNRVLGWLDDDRVLAEAWRLGTGTRYVAYDVRTGRAEEVIRHTRPVDRALQPHFATDLLRRPLVAGQAPETRAAPHWWLVAVLALLVAAGGVRRWSRHRPVEVS